MCPCISNIQENMCYQVSEQVSALFLLHSSFLLKGKANLTNTHGSLYSLHDNLQHKIVNSTLLYQCVAKPRKFLNYVSILHVSDTH